jgi:hypothetical protein
MSDSDRRRHPRLPLRIEARLKRPGQHPAIVLMDINDCGVGIEARLAVMPGTKGAIVLGTKGPERFTLHGVVAWCVGAESTGLPLYRMGMALEAISDEGEMAVEASEMADMLDRILEFYNET